jgi:Sel1 repeat
MRLAPFIVLFCFSLALQPCVAGTYDLADAASDLLLGDTTSALRLLQPLAEADDATAELLLGRVYLDHPSLSPKGCQAGVDWLVRAAEHINTEAAVRLGEAFFSGDCVARDEASAIEWYARAATAGDPDAPEVIGELYLHRGTERDLLSAQQWFLFAAQSLNPSACYHLGLMRATGLGMAPDRLEGYLWLDLAVKLAPYHSEILQAALRERDQIRETLTPIQVENMDGKAEELSSEFFSGVHLPYAPSLAQRGSGPKGGPPAPGLALASHR